MMLPLFEWFEASALGDAVRTSLWLFPVLEAIHLLGLCLLGGAVLLLDLRMLGLGLTSQRIATLAREARPWLVAGIGVMLLTGIPLFLSEAIKCYYNQSFWVKILTLPVALAFTFTVRQRMATDERLDTSMRSRALALVSLGLWFTVAAAGRWIGFS